MGRTGLKLCPEPAEGAGMMAKTLLIVGLLGWARCHESQVMSPEEKSVIRWRSVQTHRFTLCMVGIL